MLVGAPQGKHFAAGRLGAMADDIRAISQRVEIHHHWPHTVGMLRGVDAAIDHPGRPGIYGMAEAHETMERFKTAFDTPSAVSLRDVPTLWSLPDGGGGYLLRRYAVGLRARLPFAGGREARLRYVSRETDIARLCFRFSSKVEIHMDDGRRMSHEVLIPSGFAGDPDRAAVPAAKLIREVTEVSGADRARALLTVLDSDAPTASAIATCAAARSTDD
jgi:hypothetical protein